MAAKINGWTLKEAQTLLGAMRPKVNQFGYEITMGGSVLTNGQSKNDLDLYFVPLNDYIQRQPVDMLIWMGSKFGVGKTIVSRHTNIPAGATGAQVAQTAMTHKMRFDLSGRKIDVFVV